MKADVQVTNVFADEKTTKILRAAADVDWSPKYSEIAEITGLPVSTVFDRMKRIERDLEATLVIKPKEMKG